MRNGISLPANDFCYRNHIWDSNRYWSFYSSIMSDIVYNEVPGYKYGDWRGYARHNDKEIAGFFGEYRWLSNFHVSPVSYEGVIFPSVENAYQAAKFDKNVWSEFIKCNASDSKKFGRSHTMKFEIAEWDALKIEIMGECILSKFSLDRQLRAKLIETSHKHLEGTNHWQDLCWGVCNERGENYLGKILMATRQYWQTLHSYGERSS